MVSLNPANRPDFLKLKQSLPDYELIKDYLSNLGKKSEETLVKKNSERIGQQTNQNP